METIAAGNGGAEDWEAVAPFFYGKWDATTQAHKAAGDVQKNQEAAIIFGAEGVFDPGVTCAALADFGAPNPTTRR